MTEREAQQAVRPHASGVHVLHPLRGTYTTQQRETIRWFEDAHDEVTHRLLADGTVHLEVIDYDEDDSQTVKVHSLSRDGIPF